VAVIAVWVLAQTVGAASALSTAMSSSTVRGAVAMTVPPPDGAVDRVRVIRRSASAVWLRAAVKVTSLVLVAVKQSSTICVPLVQLGVSPTNAVA